MKSKLKKLYQQLIVVIKDDIMRELEEKLSYQENQKDDLDDPLTVKEICEHYKIHSSTLERYVRQGLGYTSNGKNCKRLFTKRDYNKFLKRKK